MKTSALQSELLEGLDQLNLKLSGNAVEQLLQFASLILKWNKVYNLTALRTEQEILTHHLLDSLSIVSEVEGFMQTHKASRLLDVGSGAGLPGLVLAIALPELQVQTVDAVQKKVAFMQQAIGSLRLTNAVAVHERVENLPDDRKFDLISSRAFSTMADMLSLTSQLLAQGGHFLAMKGRLITDDTVPQPWKIQDTKSLKVPFLREDRHLFIITR